MALPTALRYDTGSSGCARPFWAVVGLYSESLRYRPFWPWLAALLSRTAFGLNQSDGLTGRRKFLEKAFLHVVEKAIHTVEVGRI